MKESKMSRAVSLVGMMSLTEDVGGLPLLLLLRDIVTGDVVHTMSGIGHEGLIVRDDVPAERWQAIVAIVRKRYRKAEFPMYERVGSRWRYVKVIA